MSQKKNEGILFSTEIRVVGSYTDRLLIRTPHYYGQFALPLGKETPYIYSKFNPLNTDTLLIRTPHYYGQFALPLGK